MMQLVQADKQHLLQKLDKKKNDFATVQSKMREAQEKQLNHMQSYREQVVALTNQVEVTKQDLINAMNLQSRAHEEEMNALAVNHEKKLAGQLEELDRLTRTAKQAQGGRSFQEEAVRRAEREAASVEQRKTLRAAQTAMADVVAKEVAKFEKIVADKEDELARLRKEQANFQLTKVDEVRALSEENAYLHECLERVSKTIVDLENGVFPLVDRNGRKTFQLPLSAKVVPPDADKLPYRNGVRTKKFSNLHALIEQSRALSASDSRASSARMPSSRATSAASGRVTDSAAGVYQDDDDDDDAARGRRNLASVASSPDDPEIQRIVAERVARVKPWTEADIGGMPKAELRQHAIELTKELFNLAKEPPRTVYDRDGIAELERQRIENAVLDDLADDKTVAYIRRLEEERTHYQEQLRIEVRRTRELRAALDASARLRAKQPPQRAPRPLTARR